MGGKQGRNVCRDIGRLQAFGNITAHRNGWHTVTPSYHGLLHTHLYTAYLRQWDALPLGTGHGEVTDAGRIKPGAARRPCQHLHGTDVFPHSGDGDAIEQKLQLLRHRSGTQAKCLQAVLLQGEMQCWHTYTPVGVDGAHLRAGVHDLLNFIRNLTQHLRIRAGHSVGHREGRIGAEHQLGDTQSGFGSQAVSDGLTQAELQRFALFLTVGAHYDFGERWIRQLGPHGEEKPWRTLTDVGGYNPRLLLPPQPGLYFGGGIAGLEN